MAISCKSRSTINIKDLPVIESIDVGDFFIVETEGGTSILDFSNLIITLDNTTFGGIVTNNTTNILILSADIAELDTTLSARISSLSAEVVRTNTFSTFSYTSAGITQLKGFNTSIDPGTSVSTFNTPGPITIFFDRNFPDSNYCVSAHAQFMNIPIILAVLETTTNSITVRGYTLGGAPSFIDKGWVRITTT
jgi:hypothetical protein